MKGPLYQRKGVKKPDLIWDTNTLFSLVPAVKPRTEIKLADGAPLFRQSTPIYFK